MTSISSIIAIILASSGFTAAIGALSARAKVKAEAQKIVSESDTTIVKTAQVFAESIRDDYENLSNRYDTLMDDVDEIKDEIVQLQKHVWALENRVSTTVYWLDEQVYPWLDTVTDDSVKSKFPKEPPSLRN